MSIDSETIGFGPGLIKILDVDGYDDGYYWDYRVFFECDSKPYTYICMGSGSWYIRPYIGIKRGVGALPKGKRFSYGIHNVDIEDVSNEEMYNVLRDGVKSLIKSGEDEMELDRRTNNF